MFYAKIDPWDKKLMDSYNLGSQDTLGKMLSFLQE